MRSRAERRRQSRGPVKRGSLAFSREVTAAVILAVAVVGVVGAYFLLSGDDDDDGGSSSATSTPGPAYSPGNSDEAAIADLARASIEALPRNQWPALYEDFTSEFQARCARGDFVQSGVEAAQEQGANLTRLGFVRLEDVSIQGDQATATIIGEIRDAFEYEVYAAFQRQDGVWKLAPAEGTSGCQAFNRP